MAPYESDDNTPAGEVEDVRDGRRAAARYVVPVAVVGVAAATIGLVPAFAGSGDPTLPKISAQQLIEKIAKSDVQQLSGTVKISTDLGLPNLGGLQSSFASGALGKGAGGKDGSAADPSSKLLELASGTHTLRVATDGQDKQKLSLIEQAAEYSVIRNGTDVWGYDSASNSAYHSTAAGDHKSDKVTPRDVPATPKDLAEQALKATDRTTSVTVDGTAQIAGRDAYKLLIKPKQSGTTVGAISIAVDAKTGLPLKFTLTPASGGAAVVDVGFTEVSFAKPAASTFDFTPPKGAKVTQGDDRKAGEKAQKPGPKGREKAERGAEPKTIGQGWNSIVVLDTGSKGGLPSASSSGNSTASGFLNSLGDHVSGKFGSGTVFSTRLVNALITDNGKVYAGAVTKDALLKAANAGK
ncbi:membrane protein [Streptomyces hygroscopicus]|uniref:LolA family protein n=1 Tax=Streptomyces hygroscopicus TaxID=1912 RepID=UPI00223F7A98|nr:sigma-E factor regulatory protein RseB domain-containing protein [Streptomyces hygroscopicus]MCW7945593.1 membrane protein [Streptomyces hygroscopicus]